MNRIYLYGIAGASDKYAVVRYQAVDVEHRPIDAIKNESDIIRMDYRDLKNMDQEEFYAMKKCLEFVDSACELMVEEAELMDDLNYKLDKVLALLNKEES